MRVRTDRLSPARRALVIWRSRWRVSSCKNPARFVGRSGRTERRSNELNWRPCMTKAGSPVSDETRSLGFWSVLRRNQPAAVTPGRDFRDDGSTPAWRERHRVIDVAPMKRVPLRLTSYQSAVLIIFTGLIAPFLIVFGTLVALGVYDWIVGR